MQFKSSYNTYFSLRFCKKNSAFGLSRSRLSRFFILLIFSLFAKFSNSQIVSRIPSGSGTVVGTNITVNKPTGTIAGDFMIANISTNGNNIITTSPGWTLLKNVNTGTGTKASISTILYKVVNASDATTLNYTFSLGAANTGAAAAIVSFSGVDTIKPIDTAAVSINIGTTNPITAAGISTLTPKTALVMFGQAAGVVTNATFWNSSWTTTSPGALTEIYDQSGTNTSVAAAWASKIAAGATGNGTNSITTATRWGAILVALRSCIPKIITQPTTTIPACVGGTVPVLSFVASGMGTITNQWYSNLTNSNNGGTLMPGETSTSYTSSTATAGTYYYYAVVTGSCGKDTSTVVTVNVNNNNSISLSSPAGTVNQALCINTPVTNITYATTGATNATFSGLPAGVTGGWAANVVTINGTPTAAGTFNYTVTLTGGCGVITTTGTIISTANNTILLTSAAGTNTQTKCINTAITNITYSSTGANNATFTGLPSGVTGSWAANVATISGTPTVSGTFPYTITLTGGCGNITASGTITVTANNTITLTSAAGTNAQTKCISTAITNITYSTTGATGATFSGLPAGVTGGWTANVATISGTPSAAGTFNYTVTLTGGCATITASGTITVTANNTTTLTSAAGTNAQTLCINIPVTNITYATTGATNATFSGLPAGVTGSWASNIATISGTPTAAGTFSYTVTLTGGCGAITASGTIIVTANNTITLTSAAGTNVQTKCINIAITNIVYTSTGATNATFSGLPAGVTGGWAANVITISGTPTAAGTSSYIVTLTGGCGTITASGTITTTANNTITLTSLSGTNAQTLCINTPVTNITYATTGATNATFSGLPAGVAGSWAANVVTISGTPTVGGTFTYTVTLTGGCGTITASGTVVVTANNTITLTSLAGTNVQTKCINTAITNITYSTTGGTNATFIGLPAGVTGSWAANIATISGTPTAAGAFPYTVTLTGGCGNITASGTITVTANNTITLTSAAGTNAQTKCISTAITNITYTTTGATGATFSGLPAGVTGGWAANVVTISGTPTAAGTSSYTVTLTGGCGIITASGTITVTANNTTTLTSAVGTNAQTLCINIPVTNITYSTIGATGATFAGLPAGVTGNWAANIVTISGTPTAAGTFSYTVTLTGGCGAITTAGTIIVTANNTITLTSAAGTNVQTKCINIAITNIVYTSTGATNATFSGLPAGVTGTRSGNTITITGTPSVSGIFNYTVTLTGGCGNVTASGTITVNATNTILLSSAVGTNAQTKCTNTAITNITYSTTVATNATFAGLPAGVTGSWAANIATISGTPTAAGNSTYTVTLTGGCGTVTATGTIAVSASTSITTQPPASLFLCPGGTLSITAAASGTGNTYQWKKNGINITGATTIPYTKAAVVLADSGTYTITVTNGCGTVTSQNCVVKLASGVSVNIVADYCAIPGRIKLTAVVTPNTGSTTAYTYSWTNGSIKDTALITLAGTYSVTVTPTAATSTNTGCLGTATASIIVSQELATNGNFELGNTGFTCPPLLGGAAYQYFIDSPNYQRELSIPGRYGIGTDANNYNVTFQGKDHTTGTGNFMIVRGYSFIRPMAWQNTVNVSPNTTYYFSGWAMALDSNIFNLPILSFAVNGSIVGFPMLLFPHGQSPTSPNNWQRFYVTWNSGTATTASFSIYDSTATFRGNGFGLDDISIGPISTFIALTSSAATDTQTVCINVPIQPISFLYGSGGTPVVTGLPTGVNYNISGSTLVISGSPTVSGTFNYTVATVGCSIKRYYGQIISQGQNITLTSAIGTNSQSFCAGNSLLPISYNIAGSATTPTITGLPTGANSSFNSGVFTISGIPTQSGLFNYTITALGGTCAGSASVTGSINVNALPVVTITVDSCSIAGKLVLKAVPQVPGTYTYLWNNGSTSDTLSVSVSGNYSVVVTSANGCSASQNINISIGLALTSAATTSNQNACLSTPISNIVYSAGGNMISYNVTGLPIGVIAAYSAGIITISGATSQLGTFNYTLTFVSSLCGIDLPVSYIKTGTIIVNTNPAVSISADYCAVNNRVKLTAIPAPAGTYTYSWSSGSISDTALVNIAGNFTVTVTNTAGCRASASYLVNTEISINGNFSLGNTGFSSVSTGINVPYVFVTDSINFQGELAAPGLYGVDTNANNYNVDFWGHDHTTGSGKFMIVHGNPFSEPIAWQETLPVLPNTTYYFSAWAMGLDSSGDYASLAFSVNGNQLGNNLNLTAHGLSPTSRDNWQRFYSTWNSGTNTSAIFRISNTPSGFSGNSFGLDDISIGTITPYISLTSSPVTDTQFVCINTPIQPVTFTYGSGGAPTITGLPTGVTMTVSPTTITISGTPSVAGTFNYTISTIICSIKRFYGQIISQSTNLVLASATTTNNQTICINSSITNIVYTAVPTVTAVTITGLPAGVSYVFNSGILTISGTPTVSGVFNYTITITGGGCTTTSTYTGTITIKVSPVVNITVDYCTIPGKVILKAVPTPAGAHSFSWSNGGITDTTSVITAGTYTVTATNSVGCQGTASVNITLGILLTSAATSNNQNVCLGDTVKRITYSTGGNITGVTITGLPSGVSYIFAANTITITGTPLLVGTYNYSVITTVSCGTAPTATGTIIVVAKPIVTIKANYCLIPGKIRLTAIVQPVGTYTYLWSNSATTDTTSVMTAGNHFVTVTNTSGCSYTASIQTSIELAENGNFNAGNTGFNTPLFLNQRYQFVPDLPNIQTELYFPGLYGIDTNANNYHDSYRGHDHTTGNGNFMIVHAFPFIEAIAWERTTPVIPNTVYYFSAWAQGLDSLGNNAILKFTVNGNQIGSNMALTNHGQSPNARDNWARFYSTWNSGASTTAIFGITDVQTISQGNSFGLDDISIGTISPFITLMSAPATDTQTVCLNTAIDTVILYIGADSIPPVVSGLPSGVTYTFNGYKLTISGIPNTLGVFNYTVATSGCLAKTFNGQITSQGQSLVLTSPTTSNNQTVCIGSPIINITYSTGGNIDSNHATITGLPPGVSYTVVQGLITISGTPSIIGTYNYTLTVSGGICSSTSTTVTSTGTINIISIPTVIILSDYCSVPGRVKLRAVPSPAGIYSFYWNNGALTDSTIVDLVGSYTVTVTNANGCSVSTSISVSNELVVNGDFNQGNVGFTSPPTGTQRYTYVPDSINYQRELYPAGKYGIAPNANYLHDLYWGHDHTTGTGNFMVVHGNSTIAPILWQETVAVTPNTNYYFSGWGMSLNNFGFNGRLKFSINSVQVGATLVLPNRGNSNASPDNWTRFYTTWNSGTSTSVVLSITNTQTSFIGNSFGVDDISFASMAPFITLISSPLTDTQTVCINTPIVPVSLNIGSGGSVIVTGLPAGVTYTYNGYNLQITGSPTVIGTFNYAISLSSNCAPKTFNGQIIVLGQTMTLSSAAGTNAQTKCINTAITNITYSTTGATGATFAGLPAGVTGSWATNIVTISGTPTVSGTFNYTVTLTGNCQAATASGTITVNPNNTITLTSLAGSNTQALCINTPLPNIVYSTTSATGATFAGLPAGVTGNWTANVITISGTPTASGTFNYIVTLTGGCGIVTATGSIIVTPNNTITLTSVAGTIAQSVCINTAITNITYNTTGATGATFAGLPAGVTGNWASNTVTISGTPTTAGTFNYTVTLTGGCGAITASGSIIVNPNNTITLTSLAGTIAQTLCVNTAITNISYTTTGATGATFTGLPAGVTGNWAANIITINGTPTAAGTSNYTITLTGGCGTVTATGSITVNPNNTIALSSLAGTNAQTVCVNNAITNIAYNSTEATGATFTGLPTGVTGNWAANSITISGTPTTAGTSNYTITLTGGCGSITASGTITVNPNNSLTLTSAPATVNQIICLRSPINNITMQSAGNFTSVTASGLPSGLTTTFNAGVFTISGTATQSGIFNFIVSNTGTLCAAASISGTININASPTALITNNPSTVISCSSQSITLTAAGGTTYNWAGGLGNNAIITVTNPGVYAVIVTNTLGCVDSSAVTITAIIPSNSSTWLGINSNWSNLSNWCGGIPDATKSVLVPSAVSFYPVINANTNAICSSITISSGSTLTINSLASLTTSGNFINNGALTNNGKIILAGNTVQSFPGAGTITAMDTLQINNPAGVTLNKSFEIQKELRPTSGIFALGDFDITLKSNSIATASVSMIGTNAGFTYGTGRFIVERFLPTGTGQGQHGKSWQYIAVPVRGSQTIKQAWQENAFFPNQNPNPGYGTQITGEFINALALGFDVKTTTPSMKVYDSSTNTFTGVPNTNSYPIQNSKGYMIFVRGNRNDTSFNQAPELTTLRARGTIYGRGLDLPPVMTVPSAGYQSIGNPYPSTIDFSNNAGIVFNRSTSIDNAFYVWDPTLAGSNNLGGYQTMSAINNWVPVPGGTVSYPALVSSPTIQSGQAFFMHATGTGGPVSFTEDAKIKGSNLVTRETPVNYADSTEMQFFETKLYLNNNGFVKLADGNLIVMKSEFSNELTTEDAPKLNNSAENFGLSSNGKLLAIEARQPINLADTIHFSTSNLRIGNYKLSFKPTNLNNSGLIPYLLDQHLQTRTMLSFTDSTQYDFTVNSNSTSYAGNRFKIVFNSMTALPMSFTNISAFRKTENKVQINWGIEQEMEINYYDIERSLDGHNFNPIQRKNPIMNNGSFANYQNIDSIEFKQDLFYRIKAFKTNGGILYSAVARVKGTHSVTKIRIFPNPIVQRKLFLTTNGLCTGKYQSEIYSINGQLLFTKELKLEHQDQTIEIDLPKHLASGNYIFKLNYYNKLVEAKEIMIK